MTTDYNPQIAAHSLWFVRIRRNLTPPVSLMYHEQCGM